MRMTSKPHPIAAIVAAVAVVLSLTAYGTHSSGSLRSAPEQPRAILTTYIPPTEDQLAALPDAGYNAIIPSLIDAASISGERIPVVSFTLTAGLTPIYGADRYAAPIATMTRLNFTGEPTIVVPVATAVGGWTEVMTPSRNAEPSSQGGHAASQTMGWVRSSSLESRTVRPVHLAIDISDGTMSIIKTATGEIMQSFYVGVGKERTDSPLGLTYLQARYVDPAQAEGHPINLTGAHSAVADHPYGPDAGLIAAHFASASTGKVSHGCVRLTLEGSNAVSQLPVGTPVMVTQ